MIGNLNTHRNKTANLEVNRYAEVQVCMRFQLVLLVSFSTVPSPPAGQQQLFALCLAVSPCRFRQLPGSMVSL